VLKRAAAPGIFVNRDNTNSTAALIDALRLYLVSGATK
jgi:hypothetical protein